MSYFTESQKTRSEKIVLVTLESVGQVRLFDSNGSDWDRVTDHFVVSVREDGVPISSWTYTPNTKTLKIIGGADPRTRKISLIYRHFYASAPVNLPWDLDSGEVVEWEARVNAIGTIGQRLDDESTGIVLESSSSVDLENTDGHFDPIFDTHIWENQIVKFYSWFPGIPIEQRDQLFEGVIETKLFNSRRITFRVKDFVFRLRNKLIQRTYGEFANGSPVLPVYVNSPMNRIYGQADNVKCVSFSAQLDGVEGGTLSGAQGSTALTIAGFQSTGILSPGDEIIVVIDDVKYKMGIEVILSDTSVTTSSPIPVGLPSLTPFRFKTRAPTRFNNRSWIVCGHKLRERNAEILIVQAANTFLVDDASEFEEGDQIVINGKISSIRRVYENKLVTSTNISPAPSAGDLIERKGIIDIYLGDRELVYIRDYSQVNVSGVCRIELDPLAEFNIADQRVSSTAFTFTNGSNIITTSASVDLRSFLKTNDWVRSSSVSRPDWYEILDVAEQSITLRTDVVVSGGPHTEGINYKSLDIIDENSLVTASCYGMEKDGVWIRTASDAVRDMIIDDAGFSAVNESTFAEAKEDGPYTISIVEPSEPGQDSPTIRDVITKINNSVFGSLYGDSTQNISYGILDSKKPETIGPLRDDDILDFSVSTSQRIYNEISVSYRPYIDIFSGSSTFYKVSHNSGFVDSYIGIRNKLDRTAYLYKETDATVIAQRLSLFGSMSISTVNIKSKMNLTTTLVNDKIYLELDRLYSRYGGLDPRKLGIVVGVSRNGFSTELIVSDLANIFNRVPSIAPNSTANYTSSSIDDKIKWGYILSDDTLTPDETSEEGLGNFIIG